MDEVVHLKLPKEEYHPIPAPKNIRKSIALVEKSDQKQSVNTITITFSV